MTTAFYDRMETRQLRLEVYDALHDLSWSTAGLPSAQAMLQLTVELLHRDRPVTPPR